MSEHDLNFDNVRVALLDRNMSMRRLIRSSLNSIGFSSITECRNTADLVAMVRTGEPDMIMIDIDAETEPICEIIREIRIGNLGENPFIIIIALTWHPEREVINQTLSAGADDVVTKPVSASILSERVTNLAHNRREFVVTESYIGPERRMRPDSRPSDLPTVKVPNTLLEKSTGDKATAPDFEAIRRSKREIKMQSVYRIANRLTAKTAQVRERMAKNGGQSVPRHHLRELAELVSAANSDIVREELEHLMGIGASMVLVMDGIFRSSDAAPELRQIEILLLHGQAIVASVQDGGGGGAKLIERALEKATNMIESRPAPARQSG
ncbi:MAG: response regulator [Alphaproteobacteria bacterium]